VIATKLLFPAVLLAGLAVLPVLPAQAAGTDTFANQMHRLRVCESSNNYRAATGNGYYGAYQYSPQTWRGLGYAGRPDHASVKTQDSATTKLHAREGWRPWPGCARREHLH
jgi:hypothetical protein